MTSSPHVIVLCPIFHNLFYAQERGLPTNRDICLLILSKDNTESQKNEFLILEFQTLSILDGILLDRVMFLKSHYIQPISPAWKRVSLLPYSAVTARIMLAVMTLEPHSALRQILADPTGQWIFVCAPIKKVLGGEGERKGRTKACRHGSGTDLPPHPFQEAGRNNNKSL